jgi:hypothetical protein
MTVEKHIGCGATVEQGMKVHGDKNFHCEQGHWFGQDEIVRVEEES